MKRILFVLSLSVAAHYPAAAQCVLYACNKTGAWGIGYNETGMTTATMAECEEAALKGCKMNNGINCKFWHRSNNGGWWAVIATKDINGKVSFELSENNVSQKEAETDVMRKYKAHGGMDAERVAVKSWFVYSAKKAR